MDYPTFRNAIASAGSYLERFHLHVGLLNRSSYRSERVNSLQTAVLCYNLVEKRCLTAKLDHELLYITFSSPNIGRDLILFFDAKDAYRKYRQGLFPLLTRLLIKLLHRSKHFFRREPYESRFYLSSEFFSEPANHRSFLFYGSSPDTAKPFERSNLAYKFHLMEGYITSYLADRCKESCYRLRQIFHSNLYLNALLNTCRHTKWELTSLSSHYPTGISLQCSAPAYSLWGLIRTDILKFLQNCLSADLLVGIPEVGGIILVAPVITGAISMLQGLLNPQGCSGYRIYRYRSDSGVFIEL